MNFYKYSDLIKNTPYFKKEVDATLAKKQKEEMRAVKKEMARVFQVANRRIQNVRRANLASTALASIQAEYGGNLGDRYTVFSNAHLDFTDYNQYLGALDNYAKALRFLNNPTSSATGARQYVKKVSKETGLTFDMANDMIKEIMAPNIVNGMPIVNIMDSENIRAIVSQVEAEYKEDLSRMDSATFSNVVKGEAKKLLAPNDEYIDIFEQLGLKGKRF